MIRIVKELLVRSTEQGHGTSRVVYLNGELGLGVVDTTGAMRTLGVGRRREAVTWAARMMHHLHRSSLDAIKADELYPAGIAAAEIVAGRWHSPHHAQHMSLELMTGPLLKSQRRSVLGHSRHSSDESTDSDRSRRSTFARVFR